MKNLCRCCNHLSTPLFNGKLLDFDVQYFECEKCGYVQTELPYWLDQAYSDAINDSDTGILARNLVNAKIVVSTLLLLGKVNQCVVDCAGGYGILVRLLRDYGIDAMWSDQYCQNLVARGFEYKQERAAIVTAFEAFEHFVHPSEELDRLFTIAPNVLLSTQIIPDVTPPQDQWWYYGKDHGQHIGFFRVRTLRKMVEQRGKYLVSDGASYHLITDRPISPLVWRIVTRFNGVMPLLFRRLVRSKTWGDHLLMSQKKQ